MYRGTREKKGRGTQSAAHSARRRSPDLLQDRLNIQFEFAENIRRIAIELAQILQTSQHDIDAVRIRADLAARVEEHLGELVIWRKTNLKIRVKLFAPKCNDGPQRLCCECRGDCKSETGNSLCRWSRAPSNILYGGLLRPAKAPGGWYLTPMRLAVALLGLAILVPGMLNALDPGGGSHAHFAKRDEADRRRRSRYSQCRNVPVLQSRIPQ